MVFRDFGRRFSVQQQPQELSPLCLVLGEVVRTPRVHGQQFCRGGWISIVAVGASFPPLHVLSSLPIQLFDSVQLSIGDVPEASCAKCGDTCYHQRHIYVYLGRDRKLFVESIVHDRNKHAHKGRGKDWE